MRSLILSFGLAVIVLGAINGPSSALAQGKPEAESKPLKLQEVPQVTEQQPLNFWMTHKLEYSKSILESLTMGDYEQLVADARQMRMLGKIEGFVRRKNPDYRTQLKNFDLALQELIRHAEQQDVSRAAVAFNQMTTSCVACHELLRRGID